MFNMNTNEMTQQFDNLFVAPMRAYAALSLDYSEKLMNAQREASKAYVDTGLTQMREWLSIKDAASLRDYMESQQKVAKEIAQRAKGDTDKVVALQQDFMQKSQKMTEDNVKQAQTVTTKMRRTA